MAKASGGIGVVTFLGIQGAMAAALFLVKHPGAQVFPSSANGIGRTLESLADKNLKEVHICGVGLRCTVSEVVDALAGLRRAGIATTWHCGHGYLDEFRKELQKHCKCRFIDGEGDIPYVIERFLWPRGTQNKGVRRIMGIGTDDADDKRHYAREMEDLVEGAIWRFQNYRDYDAYPHAIRVLAGVEPMSPQDHKTIHSYRNAARQVLLGKSRGIQQVRETIGKCAPTDCSVLIQGESGTGKEIVARLIHEESDRSDASFFAVNCATLDGSLLESELFGHEKGAFTGAASMRKGCFENADGGTIFLDEIAEMPLSTQAKVLRVIQERQVRRLGGERDIAVDVRILAATNKDLLDATRRKTFRSDLYYRLAVIKICIPPLRERTRDIVDLARDFFYQVSVDTGEPARELKRSELEVLRRHPWPGNVRELQNTLHRLVVLEARDISMVLDPVGPEALIPDEIQDLETYTNAYVRRVYENLDQNLTHTAKALGISLNTLKKRLRD